MVDQYDRWDEPTPIENCTEIFKAYEGERRIDRIYIAHEYYEQAESVLSESKSL